MTLDAGTRLGPYEILAPLGAGGMGEVYRARDTRLGRDGRDQGPARAAGLRRPRSAQRFEREAKTISQLSHPHICALFDVGREDEAEFLVMELLEGETLSERLAQGRSRSSRCFGSAIEIADALDKAHRQRHRPSRPEARQRHADPGRRQAARLRPRQGGSRRRRHDGQRSPSLPTAAADLTQEGTILGTFQYMAPEQLEGKEADARTDIFAFGAVLYEMATGEKAFAGRARPRSSPRS